MENTKQAVELLAAYTAGRFDIWMLAGPSKASCRAHVVSALLGHKVPQSKAGVTAIREAFYAIAKPAGDCIANREDSFVAWCKAQLAGDAPTHVQTLQEILGPRWVVSA